MSELKINNDFGLFIVYVMVGIQGRLLKVTLGILASACKLTTNFVLELLANVLGVTS